MRPTVLVEELWVARAAPESPCKGEPQQVARTTHEQVRALVTGMPGTAGARYN